MRAPHRGACPSNGSRRVSSAAVIAFCAALCGCAELGGGGAASPQTALIARQASLSEELKNLQQDLRALRASQEELEHRYSDDAFARPLQERAARLGERLDALEGRLAAIEKEAVAERTTADRKMQAVIEVVKTENAQLRGALSGIREGASPAGGEYTVRPGDTLADIARNHGVRAREIMQANGITDPDMIQAGRKLKIPRPAR
ncbi:MAG: LysM peptidoglycan-binding domain-containing protein [Chlamydiota bacterium]